MVINKIVKYKKEGILFQMIIKKIKYLMRPFWGRLFSFCKIDPDKITFDNFEGTGFGGDPKYICEELFTRKEEIKIIWFVREIKENFPSYIRQIKIDSIAAIYHQSTAKVWVDNTRTGHRTKKRTGQFYLQTWHGNIICKKAEKDAEDKLWPSYVPVAKYDGSITDAFIVANEMMEKFAKSSFWLNPNTEFLRIGSPSNDVLITKNKPEIIIDLRKKFHVDIDTYIILYAPSFRDDLSDAGYDADFPKILEAFQRKTRKKCVMFVRLHPDAVKFSNIIEYSENIINMTDYSDVKDLSLVADALITDYSSIAYDFLILRKPIFRLCLDFEHYVDIRGVYEEFFQMPYALCFTNSELIFEIGSYNEVKYEKEVDKFLERNVSFDNGHAAEFATDWILDKIK